MAGCSKNDNDRRVEYTHRTVFFGYVYIEDFGGVHMMADTLTNDRFEILVPKYLAELIPDVISNFDLEHTYEDINYEFYTLYPLKQGCKYPTLNLIFDGGAKIQANVNVVDFTDQGWVLEYYAPHLESGWPNIIIGTGAAKKYLCNTTFNSKGWNSWADITITSYDGQIFNFIKDCMVESAIVTYDWKLDL